VTLAVLAAALLLRAGDPAGGSGAPSELPRAAPEEGRGATVGDGVEPVPESEVTRTLYRVRASGAHGKGRAKAWISARRTPPGLSVEVVDPFGRLRGLLYADSEELRAHLVSERLWIATKPDRQSLHRVLGLDAPLGDVIARFLPDPVIGGSPRSVALEFAGARVELLPLRTSKGNALVRPPEPRDARPATLEEAAHLLQP